MEITKDKRGDESDDFERQVGVNFDVDCPEIYGDNDQTRLIIDQFGGKG